MTGHHEWNLHLGFIIRTGSIPTYPKFCCPKNDVLSYLWLDHCFQLLKDTLVPCDCLIINGSAIVNEATLTGGHVYGIHFATPEWTMTWRFRLRGFPWTGCNRPSNQIRECCLQNDLISGYPWLATYLLTIHSEKHVMASFRHLQTQQTGRCKVPLHHPLDRWLLANCRTWRITPLRVVGNPHLQYLQAIIWAISNENNPS